MDPKPTSELVSCGVEIMLDKLLIADDKYPKDPSPCSVDCKRDLLKTGSLFIDETDKIRVLNEVARKSGKFIYPFPEPNDKLLTVNELIKPVCVLNEIASEVEKDDKLFPIELRDETYPIEPSPCNELMSCGVDIILDRDKEDRYPKEPSPCKLENKEAEEMKVDGTEDRYPREPSPCKLENKEAEEIKLDGTEDRYPKEPSPCKLENKEAEEIKLDGTEDRYPKEPSPCKLENKEAEEMKVDGIEDR
jgi:hypothetical protein